MDPRKLTERELNQRQSEYRPNTAEWHKFENERIRRRQESTLRLSKRALFVASASLIVAVISVFIAIFK
jgi:hypothetical protein